MKEIILYLAIIYSFFMSIFLIANLFKKINLEKNTCMEFTLVLQWH